MTRRKLPFYKMHSLGNDFLVLDGVTRHVELSREQVQAWGDRHRGIGFDQLLVIRPPTQPDADFDYQIFNQDGSEAEQCGNGTRCVARLVRELQLATKPCLTWRSLAGVFTTEASGDVYTTQMTVPEFSHDSIPFDPAQTQGSDGEHSYTIEVGDQQLSVTPVSMGNPHGVVFVDDLFHTDVASLGQALSVHPAFPQHANIGFCQIIDQQFMRLRVYERGAGETEACGSGACAAVAAAHIQDRVKARVKVSLPGGKLRLAWPERHEPISMSGPASLVFRGELDVDA